MPGSNPNETSGKILMNRQMDYYCFLGFHVVYRTEKVYNINGRQGVLSLRVGKRERASTGVSTDAAMDDIAAWPARAPLAALFLP
jgi:hypothetical protein